MCPTDDGYTYHKCVDCGKSFQSKYGSARCNPCTRKFADKPQEFFDTLASTLAPIPAITFPPEFNERVHLCEFWLKIGKTWPSLKTMMENSPTKWGMSKEERLRYTDSVDLNIKNARIYNTLAVKYLHSVEKLLDCPNATEQAWGAYEDMIENRKPLDKRRRGHRGKHGLSDLDRKALALSYELILSNDAPKVLLDQYSIPQPEDGKPLSAAKVTDYMACFLGISYEQCATILRGMKDSIDCPQPGKNKPAQKPTSKHKARDDFIKKKFDGSPKSIAQLAERYGLTKRRVRQIISK